MPSVSKVGSPSVDEANPKNFPHGTLSQSMNLSGTFFITVRGLDDTIIVVNLQSGRVAPEPSRAKPLVKGEHLRLTV